PQLHALRQGSLLPGRVAEAASARGQQEQGHALLGHPRRRRDRRGADGALGEAGGRVARVGPRPAGLRGDIMAAKRVPDSSAASKNITTRIQALGDWRGETLTRIRQLLHYQDATETAKS